VALPIVQEGVAVEEIAKRFGVLPTVLARLLLNQSDHLFPVFRQKLLSILIYISSATASPYLSIL